MGGVKERGNGREEKSLGVCVCVCVCVVRERKEEMKASCDEWCENE